MLVRAELFKQGLSVVRLTGETGESDIDLDRDLQQRQQMFTVASGIKVLLVWKRTKHGFQHRQQKENVRESKGLLNHKCCKDLR